MTKQEADFIGSMNMCDEISNEAYKKIICHCDVEESQPCEDAISRAEIIHTLNTMDRYVADELTLCDTNKKYPKNEVFIVDDVYELITENLPSVTLQTKVGEWKYVTHYARRYRVCSECNAEKEDDRATGWNFCPHCGAQMNGGGEE